MNYMHHHGYSQAGHHGHCHSQGYGSGCCCSGGHGQRHFPNREEQISTLKDYLENLKAEVQGVEERIAELQKDPS
jgi:hypothetical protein